MKVGIQDLKFGTDVFDPSHRFETSWLFTPWVLFFFRTGIFLYALFVQVFELIWDAAHGQAKVSRQSFSYFTVLTYWGLIFYFAVAAAHTFQYAKHGTPLLNRWPRPLQALHHLYYTTITCYPFLVTIIYWGVLFPGVWYTTEFAAWSNVSQHAMNSLFALFEVIFPRTSPPPFVHLLWVIIILGTYCGLAYLTKATKGFYVYSFLDPSIGGSGRVAAYVAALAAAMIVIFLVVKLIIWGRKWLTETKLGMNGKFHGGRSIEQGDVELNTARNWAK